MKIENEFEIKYESLNFLEERVCEPIWELLSKDFEKLPKHCKIKITLEFEEIK